jgi:hypothetical protein
VCGASMMLARSLVLELGNYDADLFGAEDYGLSLIASTRCDFAYVPEPLYRRRRHGGNLTNHKCIMAYYHWLAQDQFRRRCPEAFAGLPHHSLREYMVEPVLRAAKEAYWSRTALGYKRLLSLAVRLAPEDEELRRLWHRRSVPMWALRAWDRWTASRIAPVES